MPPTVRPKSAPKLKLAGTGEAGSPPKMSNRRSTTSQRARKSSTSTKATPSTPKKAPPAAAIPQEAVDVVSVKSFIDELLAPRKALIGLTRAKMEQTVQRLHELGDKGVTIESTAEGAVKGAPAPAAPKPVTGAERKVAVGVWQEICREHLAEMASSLEGALSNESKLHELFNRIDLDGGGTLDLSEIRAAITLAGKDLSSEQIDLMLRTADEDHNGGIDYEEFVFVLRGGIKKLAAAKVITRSFRKAKRGRAAALGTSVLGVATSVTAEEAKTMTLIERDRLLAGALTRQKGDLKQLLKDWDRGKSGALTRVEFRMGVREDLGLHYLDSKYIDGWFDAIDKDGGGTLEFDELVVALAELEARVRQEQEERGVRRAELAQLTAKFEGLKVADAQMEEATRPAMDAACALADFRTQPHSDAKLGATLVQRMRANNCIEQTLMYEWEVQRSNAGLPFMEVDEFVALAVEIVHPAGKAAKEGAGLESSRRRKGEVTGPIRPTNPLGKSKSAAEKKTSQAGRRSSDELTIAKEREAAREAVREPLLQAGIDVVELEALFDHVYVQQFSTMVGEGPPGRAAVKVEKVVQALIDAEKARIALEEELVKMVVAAKQAAGVAHALLGSEDGGEAAASTGESGAAATGLAMIIE